MKSKRLLLMLLMALLVPWAANAQGTETLTLLDENFDAMSSSSISTGYSGGNWYAYNAGSGNNWTLNTSSSYANSGSNSVQYNYHSSNNANCYLVSAPFTVSSTMTKLEVKLFERVRSSSYTEIFEVFFVKASDVTDGASITTATHYDAIASASYTNTSYAQVTGSVTNSALAGTSVRVVVHCTSAADKYTLYIDDIKVEQTYVNNCPWPTDFVASNVTGHTAVLTWETEATAIQLQYKKATDENWQTADIETGTTCTLNLLDPETQYQARVAAHSESCGVDPETGNPIYSDWATVDFTTLVACPAPTDLAVTAENISLTQATATWTGTSESYVVSVGTYDYTATPSDYSVEEGFENTSMPTGWTHIGNGSGVPASSNAHTNSYSLKFSGATSDNVVVLPEFELEANALTIDFWSKAEGSSSGSFDLGYVTDATKANTFVALDTYTSSEHGSYTHVENFSMADAPAGARIAFRHRSGQTYWYWFIDDVTVSGVVYPINWTSYNTNDESYTFENLTPNTPYKAKVKGNCGSEGYSAETEPVSFRTLDYCMAPENLEITDITATSATFNWTEGFGDGEWKFGYKKTTDTEYQEMDVVLADLPLVLNAFEEQTTYDVRIYPLCDATKTLEDSFTTPCAAKSLPYSYGFEEVDPFDCWTPISGNVTRKSGYPHTGSYYLDFRGTTSNMIALPTFEEATNNIRVEFWTRPESTGGNSGKFAIGYMTDIADASTFVAVETYNSTQMTTTYVKKKVDFTNAPANAHIAFRQFECATNYYWFVDDVKVKVIPACEDVNNLTASNVTNHSATLTWTAAEGQTAWQIAYKAGANFDPEDEEAMSTVTVFDVEDNSYTFDKTLEASTTYYIYVRANCTASENGYGEWSDVRSFSTAIANPAPTGIQISQITPASAVVAWTAPAGDYLESYDIYYSIGSSTAPTTETEPQYTGVEGTQRVINYENPDNASWGYVWVRANHGNDGMSAWSSVGQFSIPEPCAKPTSLAAIESSPTSVTLTWVEGASWQYEWYIAYSTEADFDPEQMDPESYVEVWGNNPIPYEVTGLDPETTYYFKVKGHCTGNYGYSDWTNAVPGTTLPACPQPTDLAANNITKTTADLTWTGYSDSYTVEYQTAGGIVGGISTSFDDKTMPEGWTIEGDGTGNWSVSESNNAGGTAYELNLSWTPQFVGTSRFVSPMVDMTNVETIPVSFKYNLDLYQNSATIGFAISSDNGNTWSSLWSTELTENVTAEFNQTFTNNGFGNVRFCIYFTGTSFDINELYFDDIVIGTDPQTVPDGQWTVATENATDGAYTLEGLTEGTLYNVRVIANCEGGTYSDVYTFLTKTLKRFINAGNWDVASNWTPAIVPTIAEDVTIEAAATIPAGVVAEANIITVATTGSITIVDGGQLMNNNNITATVEKNITGYGDAEIDGYYLIANPTTSNVYPDAAGLIEGEYDLYEWYSSYEGAEWRNYKHNEFSSLNTTDGYLYANQADVNLSFLGTVRSSLNKKSTSVYVNNNTWGAWNLLGNPFVCNAYLVDNQGNALPYIILNGQANADGNYFENIANGAAIAPATGIFYEAPANGQVYFTREAPAAQAQLNLMVNQGRGMIDNAVIRFGEGQEMSKFSFRESSTKIYMPVYGKDYAIVNAGNVGEMPVSFKAEKNGTYSLSFTSKEVSFSYLHLIDNMTGNDVDLLANPSYSFDARTTDYESRFRLVFATGSSATGDNFGFINGMGNLCIFGIDGTATVQVVDVTGRMLSSETFSGSYERKLNVAPGVYMIRLINGNDVKVQKMIVR